MLLITTLSAPPPPERIEAAEGVAAESEPVRSAGNDINF